MQGRLKGGKRPRISVSLDPEDFDWIQEFESPSESYTVSRIIRAARLAGITPEDAMSSGVLEGYRDWLKAKRKKTKIEVDLLESLGAYLSQK